MSECPSTPFFSALEKIKRAIDSLMASLCILIVAMMVLLVTYQVIARYVFNAASGMSEVLSRYLFIWLILFSGAYVFGLRGHMSIEYVKQKFPLNIQISFDMFSELIIVIFALCILILGGYSASLRQMWQMDSALQIPMGVIYSAIPISGAIIVFYFFYNEIKLYRKLKALNK